MLSQQIVTLAFGAKHIPFGMLFIANDFGVPVIYIVVTVTYMSVAAFESKEAHLQGAE